MHQRLLVLLTAILTCVVGPQAIAGTITVYDNFAPGHIYDANNAYVVAGVGAVGQTILTANEFTSPGNYSVSQIDVALTWVSGTNGAVVSLWTDGGSVPGTALGSWVVSNLPPFGSTSNQVATISGIGGIALSAGANYFLVVAPADSTTWDAWNLNATGATGLVDQQIDGTWTLFPGSTLSAFDVLSGTTPEPSTFVLLGTALLGLLSRGRVSRGKDSTPRSRSGD